MVLACMSGWGELGGVYCARVVRCVRDGLGCDGWHVYLPRVFDNLFDMKQRVCAEILKDEGGNSFSLPHRKKGAV